MEGRERAFESLDEEVPVLGDLEGANGGAEDLHAEPVQHAHPIELDPHIQRALAAKRQQYPVRALLLEDIGDVVDGDGEEVDVVCEVVGGLPGRDVGVDEDGADALLAEGLHGLGAGVVELARLADGEPAGADDEDLGDGGARELREDAGGEGAREGGGRVEHARVGVGGEVADGGGGDGAAGCGDVEGTCGERGGGGAEAEGEAEGREERHGGRRRRCCAVVVRSFVRLVLRPLSNFLARDSILAFLLVVM